MRVLLVHNPGAGRHAQVQVRRLLELASADGHDVRCQSCKDDGWERALDAPSDLVAVAGGDGTVSRVVRRLAGRGIPVAPLPAGTANNLATALGIVGRPMEELIRGWANARRVTLDVGVAVGPWGRRTFVEGVGAGLFAAVVPEVDASPALKRQKTAEAKVGFALRKLRSLLGDTKAVPVRGTLDGRDISGEYVLFEAMNVPYIGPNLFLAPDSVHGDGQFDLVMATEAERARLMLYLETWQEEKKRLAVLPSLQGKVLELEWTGFPVHIDDEFWPGDEPTPASPASIELRLDEAAAVEVLLPPSSAGR